MRESPGIRSHLLINLAALALWACAPAAFDYPAIPVVLLELSLAVALFPAARMNLRTPLTPMNWALFLWQVHAVGVPLLALWFGWDPGMLPRLPGVSFINAALLLSAVAHLCFSAGAQLATRNSSAAPAGPLLSPGFNALIACAFLALGMLGMALTFGSPTGYLQYLSDPRDQLFKDDGPATLSGALGTLLRPFLPLGLVLAWSNGIRPVKQGRRRYLGSTLLLLAALIPATANFNRASMVGPVMAVLAAYSGTVKRLSARAVMFAGSALLIGALLVGAYRTVRPDGAPAPREEGMSLIEQTNVFFQVYAAGPQFTGFLLERAGGGELHLGRTLVSSILYPIPVLGKDFRASSGLTFYNHLIYNRSGITDQVIPSIGELYLNFHLVGVALFFTAVGFAVRWLDQQFRRARTAFIAATCFLVAMWMAFPIVGAVAVVSQILVYSFWPFYAYFALRGLLAASRAPAHCRERWA